MSGFDQKSFESFVDEYYSFGKDLGKRCLKESIKKLGYQRAYSKILSPITDWSRFCEFFLTYKILEENLNEGNKILDVGSPKLFSIWLATKKQLIIHATDIWDKAVAEYSHFWDEIKDSSTSKIVFEEADLLDLHYKEKEFDGLFSISTIEHAYDPDWKKKISQNFSKVLKSGGFAVITTPFGSKSIIQYKDHAEYSESLVKKHNNFFMRIINHDDLEEFKKIASSYELVLEKSYTINTFANKKGLFIRLIPVHLNVLMGFLKPKLAIEHFVIKTGIHTAKNENYEEKWKPDLIHSDIVLIFRKK